MGFGPSDPWVLATLTWIHTIITVLQINQENFQRRISWFPYRWRTQRNAIRNANCRTPRVIRSLNATGAGLPACLFQCVWRVTHQSIECDWGDLTTFGCSWVASLVKCEGVRTSCLLHCNEVVTLVRDLVTAQQGAAQCQSHLNLNNLHIWHLKSSKVTRWT